MEKKRGIDSFTLHILAMLFMLCDHLWATLFPAQEWMTCVGRLAFPIFAFMIAEGCYYTSNVKKYMLRLFLFAIISEIPFNLIMGSSVFYPFHQNVLWIFLLGVLSIQIIEKAKKKQKKWISFFVVCLVLLMDFLLVTILSYCVPDIIYIFTFNNKSHTNQLYQEVHYTASLLYRSFHDSSVRSVNTTLLPKDLMVLNDITSSLLHEFSFYF